MIKLEPKYASFCPKCNMGWYYPIDMPDSEKKQVCGYKGCDGIPIHTKMLNVECGYIYCISKDRDFLKEMNNIRLKLLNLKPFTNRTIQMKKKLKMDLWLKNNHPIFQNVLHADQPILKRYLPERRLKDRCFSVYLVVMCVKQCIVKIVGINGRRVKVIFRLIKDTLVGVFIFYCFCF